MSKNKDENEVMTEHETKDDNEAMTENETPEVAETPQKKVFVRLPRPTPGEEPELFVAVNGKGIRIKKGFEVEIPESFAEVLRNAELAADITEKFINERTQPKD
jgi:hypothetical protein